MEKIITTRLPDEVVYELKKIAETENTDTSTVIRKLLSKAMKDRNIENTLEKLRLHQISLGNAAKNCGITIWEMIDLAKEKNIDWVRYDSEEIENEFKFIKK
jgi:predicted HTH domain antitoxin